MYSVFSVGSQFRIGVDGGGTKTACILLDARGEVVASRIAPGCNPNVVGPEQARLIVTDAICALRDEARGRAAGAVITHTHIYSAGNRAFWRETAAGLMDFGRLFTADDSHPVLELATHGRPGLVLHGGTGSFVAARGVDQTLHYAGGIGWRFGDPGSGYDLGRRVIGRALLELQGWSPATRLGHIVRDHTPLGAAADAAAVTRYFYSHADPNRQIAGLAPALLRLASEGDTAAQQLVAESVGELLALALRVATRLFSGVALDTLPAGLSGPILTHPAALAALSSNSPLALAPVAGTPIEGVRSLLARAE